MDGKLLILCGERPTVDEFGDRIDEQGHLLEKRKEGFFGIDGKPVKVDGDKRVLSIMKLLGDEGTEFIFRTDMLFVDWETVMDNSIDMLQKMREYAMSTDEIPTKFILDSGKNEDLMRRAHMLRLLQLDKCKARPSIDYGFQAMDDFMQLFYKTVEKLGVVSILPAFPNKDDKDVNNARRRVISTWNENNKFYSDMGRGTRIKVLEPMMYDDFGQVYDRATEEMMRIISEPYWFEKKPDETEGPEGR